MKKLNLNKVTIANLTKNQLTEVKGGDSYQRTDFCNNATAGTIGCQMGTLQEACTNQYHCTRGLECGYGCWPA